ncbi:hypothetical protein J6590_002544 [Homalodisca vitripennis]|nr:hypothetical protein J6590_002544 [Homalodisca vitripennis]
MYSQVLSLVKENKLSWYSTPPPTHNTILAYALGQKMERRIVRTCLNKNYQVDGVWRLASNETVYKNIEPITSIIKKKRISFLGHLLRTPENRISRKIVEKLWYSKSDIKWITELKEDMRELQITVEDLKHKTNTLKILNDKYSTLQLKRNKQRIGRVVPEEERKLRSERMKKYWVDKRRKTRKYKMEGDIRSSSSDASDVSNNSVNHQQGDHNSSPHKPVEK